MKRSWGTVARVLATAEDLDFDESSDHLREQDEAFFYHARMLCAEGYLVCEWHEASNCLTIQRLTMKGHDLLECLRKKNW